MVAPIVKSELVWWGYLNQLQQSRDREAFNPEAVRDALHQYIGQLPRGPIKL